MAAQLGLNLFKKITLLGGSEVGDFIQVDMYGISKALYGLLNTVVMYQPSCSLCYLCQVEMCVNLHLFIFCTYSFDVHYNNYNVKNNKRNTMCVFSCLISVPFFPLGKLG